MSELSGKRLSLVKSFAVDDRRENNKPLVHHLFGLVRFRGNRWYQERHCENGAKFVLIGGNVANVEPQAFHWELWSAINSKIDDLVEVCLKNVPPPWIAHDELDVSELRLSKICLESPNEFSFDFNGPFSEKHHEYLCVDFLDGLVKKSEWIT